MTTLDPEALLPLPPVTFHILVALAEDDLHGYAIMREVAERTGGALKLGAGTLYRSIQRMLEQGLISEATTRPAPELDDERRRYYRLTPFGRAGRHGGSRTTGADGQTRARERARAGEVVMLLYRALLHLYPASFRAEYGEEMAAIFRRRLRDANNGFSRVAIVDRRRRGDAVERARRPRRHPRAGPSLYRPNTEPIARLRRHRHRRSSHSGIGANTAAFSITDFVLLRPLPFFEPERLVTLWQNVPRLLADGALALELPGLDPGRDLVRTHRRVHRYLGQSRRHRRTGAAGRNGRECHDVSNAGRAPGAGPRVHRRGRP